jgi:argininosuccinate lyase
VIETFTIGQDKIFDMDLAPFDILGSLAHCKMLAEVNLMEGSEYLAVKNELQELYEKAKDRSLQIDEGVEDIHSQIEILLTQKLGNKGKNIHTARSRNDQVLLDLKLFFRNELLEIKTLTEALFRLLVELSEKHKSVLMPGYTHTQVAMLSSFGLWFGAYAENLCEDMQQLLSSFKNINHNPLGSAAGYGSAFPIYRTLTTEYLGFKDLNYNVIHAQMGRGRAEYFCSLSLSSIAMTLNKLSADLIQFASQNYGFIKLDDAISTGSSIMPHKRNPDVFELIRSKTNQLMSLPGNIMQLCANLTSGYHRDFQDLKVLIFPAFKSIKDCLSMMMLGLDKIEIKSDIMSSSNYKYAYTVEAMQVKVMDGMNYRDAYHDIAQSVKEDNFHYTNTPNHSHEGSINNLCNEEIKQKMKVLIDQFNEEEIREKLETLLKG